MSDEQKPLSAEQVTEMTAAAKTDQVFVMHIEGNKYRIGLPNGGIGRIYEVSPEGIEALKERGVTVRESTPLTPEQLAGRAKYEAALAAEEARANKPLNASEVNTVLQNLSGNPDIQHMEGDVYRIRGTQERGLGKDYHLSPEAVQTLHDKNINIQNDPAPAKAEVRGREPLNVEPSRDAVMEAQNSLGQLGKVTSWRDMQGTITVDIAPGSPQEKLLNHFVDGPNGERPTATRQDYERLNAAMGGNTTPTFALERDRRNGHITLKTTQDEIEKYPPGALDSVANGLKREAAQAPQTVQQQGIADASPTQTRAVRFAPPIEADLNALAANDRGRGDGKPVPAAPQPSPAPKPIRGRDPLYVEPLADVRGRDPLIIQEADPLASQPTAEKPVYLKANHLPNGEVEFTPVGATAAKPIVAAPPAPSQTEPQAAPDPAPAEPKAASADDKPYGAYKGTSYEASVEPRSKVREAQSYLETMGKSTGTRNHAKLGHRPEDMDGIPGPSTDAAIRKFQEEHNLPVNGKLDEQTMGALKTSAEQLKTQQSERTTALGRLGLEPPAAPPAPAAAPAPAVPAPPPVPAATAPHPEDAFGQALAAQAINAQKQGTSFFTDYADKAYAATPVAAAPAPTAAKPQTPEQLRDAVNAEMANGIGKNESRVVEDFIAKNNPKATDRNSDLSIGEQAEFGKALSSKMNAQGLGDLQKLVADMQAAGVKDGTRVAAAETPSAPIIASVKAPQTGAALG
ncbi:MAG: peptidoglycan-binding domain-containing protein [Rickettsiales bacterium]